MASYVKNISIPKVLQLDNPSSSYDRYIGSVLRYSVAALERWMRKLEQPIGSTSLIASSIRFARTAAAR